jgi:acyl dehydratase
VAKLSFDSVEPGQPLQPFVRAVDQEAFWRYATGSLDYNPVHCDPEWVRTAQPFGIPTTVAHGMMTMSFMISVVTSWAYPAGLRITKTTSKFTKPVQPGWVVTCTGVVSEKHVISPGKNYVVIETKAVNQDGDLLALGETEVRFPD